MIQKLWKNKKNNRGSAMVVVIVIIAFVSIMIATLFSMSVLNVQMKGVDRKAKGNFYSAEGALEQISLGLQDDISIASNTAYLEIMKTYANKTTESERRTLFNTMFMLNLSNELKGASVSTGKYGLDVLRAYLSDEVAAYTTISCGNGTEEGDITVVGNEYIVLEDVIVKYEDAQEFETVIQTDIRLTAPNLNLVSTADSPDLFDYAIIANEGIMGNGSPSVKANVFAGKGGLTSPSVPDEAEANLGFCLNTGSKWKFLDSKRLVVDGTVEILGAASLHTGDQTDFWAEEIHLSGHSSSMYAQGRTFVEDDLLIQGSNDKVTLAGEYYGYGNNVSYAGPYHNPLQPDKNPVLANGEESSAILINGRNTTLDMLGVDQLLVAGSAQITAGAAGSFEGEDGDKVNMKPENDASWEGLKKKPAVLAQGAYTLQSVDKAKLVQSKVVVKSEKEVEGCLMADQNLLGKDSNGLDVIPTDQFRPELRFILVTNADGTISFMDRVAKRYVTVKGEDSILAAEARAIGTNEKFYAYTVEGMVGNVVLKTYKTNKYVTVENKIGDKQNVLCANRDKLTDKSQMFILKMCGEKLTVTPDVDPEITDNDQLVTFTNANTSSYVISLSIPEWSKNETNDDAEAWIYLSENDGKIDDGKGYGKFRRFKKMPMSNAGKRVLYLLPMGDGCNSFNYTIFYTVSGKISDKVEIPGDSDDQAFKNRETMLKLAQENSELGLKVLEGCYNKEKKKTTKNGNSQYVNGIFVDGVYYLNLTGSRKMANVTNNNGILEFDTEYTENCDSFMAAAPDDRQDAKFMITNLKDEDGKPTGEFIIRSLYGDTRCLQLQPDGSLKAIGDPKYPTPNDIFSITYWGEINEDKGNRVVLTSHRLSHGKGQYIVPTDDLKKTEFFVKDPNATVKYSQAFHFQWIAYKDDVTEITPEPPTPVDPSDIPFPKMSYLDEDSSQVYFDSIMWDSELPVGIKYKIDYFDPTKTDKEVGYTTSNVIKNGPSGKKVKYWEVDGLSHLDRVIYSFEYSYIDHKGVEQKNVVTPKYVYIHETIYGDDIQETATEKDIILGESLEIKSNQVAYLVPAECIGTKDGEAIIGRNPMTTEEYVRLANAEVKGTAGFKMIDFDKPCAALGDKKLLDYIPAGDPYTDNYLYDSVIKKVFVQTAEGTMVYFYVNFNGDMQSQYFRDFYAVNQNSLQNYMHDYIVAGGVRLKPNDFTRRTTDGNLLYSANTNTILVSSNENLGGNMTDAEKNSLQNEINGYRKSYRALTKKLVIDYTKVSPAEDQADETVFSNLINESKIRSLPDGVKQSVQSTDADGNYISAVVIDYPESWDKAHRTYTYNASADPTNEIRVILTNGNVKLEKDFKGIIIAGGTVTVEPGVSAIESNKNDIQRLLAEEVSDVTVIPSGKSTFAEKYFKGMGAILSPGGGSGPGTADDFVPLNELVTYEEWSKN